MMFYKTSRDGRLVHILFLFFTIKECHFGVLYFHKYSNTMVNTSKISSFTFALISFLHCF